MSLINDALKRARESQQKNPPRGAMPLPPVETGKKARDLSWVLPVLTVLLIIIACFLIGLAMAHRTVATIVNAPDPSATQAVEVVVSRPLPDTNAPVVTAPPVEPKLQGIFYDPTHPTAIIDGRSVSIGSRVGDLRVKEISKYTVTLEGTNGLQQKINLGN